MIVGNSSSECLSKTTGSFGANCTNAVFSIEVVLPGTFAAFAAASATAER